MASKPLRSDAPPSNLYYENLDALSKRKDPRPPLSSMPKFMAAFETAR
jgi:hypothetical protein